MKKITFALNYRKPKIDYSPTDKIEICIRYSHFDTKTNTHKIKNISCKN